MAHVGYIFNFISKNNRYFRCLYNIWNKIISFDMRKKGKFEIGYRKGENKGEFECSKSESFMFQRGCPNHAWTKESKPSYIQTNSLLVITM